MTERLYPGGYSSFPPGMRHHLVHVTSQDSCDVTPEKLSFREIEFFPQTCQGLNLVGTQFVKTPHEEQEYGGHLMPSDITYELLIDNHCGTTKTAFTGLNLIHISPQNPQFFKSCLNC